MKSLPANKLPESPQTVAPTRSQRLPLHQCEIACTRDNPARPSRKESSAPFPACQRRGGRSLRKNKKPLRRKIVLRLPDPNHAKNSVLNTLSSPNWRRNYRFALEQFITWYGSEPRLALNRTVVLRFRLHLESLGVTSDATRICRNR
jgi:hypothetical protein